MDVTVHLEPEVALFYTKLAAASGRLLPQVLTDALFLLAGELSLEALQKPQRKDTACTDEECG